MTNVPYPGGARICAEGVIVTWSPFKPKSHAHLAQPSALVFYVDNLQPPQKDTESCRSLRVTSA